METRPWTTTDRAVDRLVRFVRPDGEMAYVRPDAIAVSRTVGPDLIIHTIADDIDRQNPTAARFLVSGDDAVFLKSLLEGAWAVSVEGAWED